MKGHKFKLDVVLKLRKIKEDVCKTELGKLQTRKSALISYKKNHLIDISDAYKNQEEQLKTGLSVQELRAFPVMIEEKREHILRIDKELEYLNEDIDNKIQELAKLKGDVKVISKMKDKSLAEYKKNIDKKNNENIEEQNQNWNLLKDII